MLKIVEYIKTHGIESVSNDLSLIVKDYGHKIIIKYNMIDSNFSKEEVRECRGLVLEKDTLRVMSYPFYKFFNLGEGHAAEVDWSTAKVLEKLDGTMIGLYYDWILNKWEVGTTGTADASGEVNNHFNTTFADLFWYTINKMPEYSNFVIWLNENKGKHTFIFELTTPENQVVKVHQEYKLTLLGVRDLTTLKELDIYSEPNLVSSFGIPVSVIVKSFDIKNVEEIKASFSTIKADDEGYVVVDANFNRQKIKNPSYVALHHLRDSTMEWKIVNLVLKGEVEEYLVYFPDRRKEVESIQQSWETLHFILYEIWEWISGYQEGKEDRDSQKKFALTLFNKLDTLGLRKFSGLFFSLRANKTSSIEEWFSDYDEKELWKFLKKY